MSNVSLEGVQRLPAEWQATSVVRHINAPFSDEALAEPEKTSIDLGPVDIEGCRGYDNLSYLKLSGEEATWEADTPEALADAHEKFLRAARLILGNKKYLDSVVLFTYRDNPVLPGSRQVGIRPHIDGQTYDGAQTLTLLGVACSSLPTVCLQGKLKRSQLEEKGALKSMIHFSHRFRRDPIPVGRLILTPPALLHDGAIAPRELKEPVDRTFLRWHLKV